jgi:Uma2 family endonuclease
MRKQQEIEHYSVDDYRLWEGNWELIDGTPYAMAPSPAFGHQLVAMQIVLQLGESLEDCPYCQALYEIDVEFSEDTVVRPDVLVICYQPENDRLTRAPDLIFEIVSGQDARQARRDEVIKFDLYRDEGVGHYVLVYPESRKAKVYRLIEGEYRKVGDFSGESQRFDLSKCSIDFDFSRLWRRKGVQK